VPAARGGAAAERTQPGRRVLRRRPDHGEPAATIEEQDFSPLLRAREELGGDPADGMRARRDAMLDRLEVLQ